MKMIMAGTLVAVLYGSYSIWRHKAPLFYTIIYLAMVTGLMGAIYTLLYEVLGVPKDMGFHVGHLGFTGMYFFLYSSYYGAMDSLVDGKEPELKKYRIIAAVVSVLFFSICMYSGLVSGKQLWILILVVPMSCTVYYACKHLIIPDVEMGIIRVMRPYNGVIICLSFLMMQYFLLDAGLVWKSLCGIGSGILLTAVMPVAGSGVRKWYI